MTRFFAALDAAADEQPLIVELWQYFYNVYLNPSEYYENINLGSGTILSVRMVILGLCIGLALAGFGAVFNKRTLGDIVRKLLAAGALSREHAMTLEELGCEGSFIARWAVRKSTSLRRVVKCREEQEFNEQQDAQRAKHNELREKNKGLSKFHESEYKINPYADAFYIPEEMKYMADVKFEKKGTTWFGACMFAVVMLITFIALMVALPHILSLINDIAGGIDTSPKNIL